MPDPKPNESREDYMDRCMGDSKMVDEFGNPQQRAAVCNSYFEEKTASYHDEDEDVEAYHHKKKNASEEYEDWGEETVSAAEYQGRKVTLNKPFRTSGGPKKFAVYTKNEKGTVVIVRFGDPNMEIKRDDPKRRKAFRDRHNCSTPGPKWKARYWSCRQWRSGAKVEASDCGCGCEDDIMIEMIEAEMIRRDVFDNPGEAMERAKELGCDKIHQHDENGKTVFMPCNTHEEYMDKNQGRDVEVEGDKDEEDEYERSMKRNLKYAEESGCGCGGNVEAKKHDPRSTPAPKKDQKKGSKRNKPGSATPGGKVTFSESVTNSLKNKVKEHNEKSDKKVTLGMLKAVYRRGAGAYSTSHRPGVSRAAWSMARVNAFLKLVRSGKPSNPKYVQDNDLLPSNHARKSKKAASECGYGEEMVDGECRKVAVSIELEITDARSVVSAETGQSVIEIKGIAFHEGINKNNWRITREAAEKIVIPQMIGADLTLNHPKPNKVGFSRNMAGDTNEAVVGIVNSASIVDLEGGRWEVKYTATVYRPELFEALESGLWLRKDYGVSIGGYGVPTTADENGMMTFADDFTFDHLAIVYRPAYPRATIDTAERVETAVSNETLISHSSSSSNQEPKEVIEMSEEMNIEATKSEMEDLKAQLVLANARVSEFETLEAERVENARQELVVKATDMGLKGHEDLSADVIKNLISSWEAAHPVEEKVEMKPVEASTKIETPVEASENKKVPVVANYLNNRIVETPEDVYERAYNAWASAWNKTVAPSESGYRAKSYKEIKEMI